VNLKSLLLGASLLGLSSPAVADHMGPSGFGSGGAMTVFSPETMDGDHWAAGFRLAYTRAEQRSDEALEALAEQRIAAHNIDYNLNASLGFAYGLNHHITLSAELPYVRRDNLREADDGVVERPGSVAAAATEMGASQPLRATALMSAMGRQRTLRAPSPESCHLRNCVGLARG
jgi:hypothetical protein